MTTDKLGTLAEEILQRTHNIERMSAEMDDSYILKRTALKAMQAYHEAKMKEELIKFLIWYHPSAAQIEPMIEKYLKQRTK